MQWKIMARLYVNNKRLATKPLPAGAETMIDLTGQRGGAHDKCNGRHRLGYAYGLKGKPQLNTSWVSYNSSCATGSAAGWAQVLLVLQLSATPTRYYYFCKHLSTFVNSDSSRPLALPVTRCLGLCFHFTLHAIHPPRRLWQLSLLLPAQASVGFTRN